MKPAFKGALIALLIVGGVSYMIKKGKDAIFPPPVELSGSEIGQLQISELSKETGIVFPPNTIGLNYLYLAVRDPAAYAKLKIPKGHEGAFLKNEIFSARPDFAPFILIAHEKPWWRPQDLLNIKQVRASLPGPTIVECSTGKQDGDLIVYVAWMRP